jgi:hypothetical protein
MPSASGMAAEEAPAAANPAGIASMMDQEGHPAA